VLLAFSWICFTMYPSVDTHVIQSGDGLRLGFFLILLAGATREIDRYWGQLAAVGVFEERRRLARDLHDGLAQELAFVVTQTRMLVRGNAPPGTDERVAAAAERALDESRRAITALTSTVDEPLHLAVARAAEDVAGRVGLKVLVEASPLVQVTPDIREALARIVREAVSNAGRHGEAQEVRISLTADRTLRITDDGRGFDPLRPKDGRYGLVSMRERAERIGGKLDVISSSGNGTTIEVRLP
jgi:signal transduction histidine kinase